MTKIACGVCECSHNKDGDCYANFVSIVGANAGQDCETCCSSFLNRETYSELTNNTEIGSNEPCECLNCKVASCSYNDDYLCNREHIEVKTGADNTVFYSDTKCSSFKPR